MNEQALRQRLVSLHTRDPDQISGIAGRRDFRGDPSRPARSLSVHPKAEASDDGGDGDSEKSFIFPRIAGYTPLRLRRVGVVGHGPGVWMV